MSIQSKQTSGQIKALTFTLAIVLEVFTTISAWADIEPGDEADEKITVNISAPNGWKHTYTSFRDSLLWITRLVPEFQANGNRVSDPIAMLKARTVGLRTGQAREMVRWQRDGNSLSTKVGDEVRRITWDRGFQTINFHAYEGTYTVSIDGLSSIEDRQRVIGAIALLGANGCNVQPYAVQAPVVIAGVVIVVVGVGWGYCMTYGLGACSNLAETSCGAGNVASVSVDCGVGGSASINGKKKGGFDLSLGFGCEITCKDNDPNLPDIPPGFPPKVPDHPTFPSPDEFGFGGCPPETRPDICVVGYEEVGSYDDSGEIMEVTVELVPITEMCCVPMSAE